jgi:hypothetical protein
VAADLQSGDETMVHRITIVAVIAAIAVGCLYLSWLGTVSPPPPWPAPASAGESQKAKAQSFVGTDSCSGRSCHGGIEQEENKLVAQDEYTKWLLQDPHAGAYEALFNSRSKRIAKNLNIARKPKIEAHEDPQCLACHSLPDSQLVAADSFRAVGCEACHGSAEKWLQAHSADQWTTKKLPASEKTRYGMTDVHDAAACASACVKCHVGDAPPRDVNHDLIAAGHPRLNFEYAAYRANLPPHWKTIASKEPSPAQSWAIGQVVAAEQSLKLLAHRAKDKERWPEFAEYDCYACHHNLSDAWRQKRTSRMPGSLSWGTWYFAMIPELAATQNSPRVGDLLDNVRGQMQSPLPRQVELAGALTALGELRKTIEGFNNQALNSMLDEWLSRGPEFQSWDMAEQFYLAACALRPRAKALRDLESSRGLPEGFDSPRGFNPETFFKQLSEAMK